MSPIEKLKAEAVALRAAENAAGRPLKHCEALERVAKKHGYANWRACLAALGAEPETAAAGAPPVEPAPPADGAASGEFRPSRLAEGDFAVARESAFTRWMSAELRQAAVDFSRNLGLLPLYAETSENGTRYLFWQAPAGVRCEVRSGRAKEDFLELDRRNRAAGRRLVSLHVGPGQRHSAVWLSAGHCAAAAAHLRRFGIE
ncbi:MAG: hypothetical protein JSS11_00670 [Verrucomicrobia bacterium]|nr:hypothetical protein [Verrucomicrobiota bacterium]